MAINPDPKPGRWILPLVVLGMVAFTYFFVRALPTGTEEDPTGTTLSATNTTFPGTTGDTVPASTSPGVADPAVQAYLDGVGAIQATMGELQAEMTAVNGGFDADPRTVEYDDAEVRLEALAATAEGLVAEIDALVPPDLLVDNHDAIRTAITTAAAAGGEALAGLRSEDDGSQRRNAVTAFESAVNDLTTAVENARSAAGLAAAPTTTAPTGTTVAPTTTAPTDTTGTTTGDG